jgi:hypothetical protein
MRTSSASLLFTEALFRLTLLPYNFRHCEHHNNNFFCTSCVEYSVVLCSVWTYRNLRNDSFNEYATKERKKELMNEVIK